MTWAADNRREDSTRSIVSSEASLAHAGAIVADQSGNFVVAHFRSVELSFLSQRQEDANATQLGRALHAA